MFGKKQKKDEPLKQEIAFNKVGKDGQIYGFNMTFWQLYEPDKNDTADVNIDFVNNEDINILIKMLSALKGY